MKITDTSGGAGNSNQMGIHVTKPNCPLMPYTLSWDQPTIFRPFGAPNAMRTGVDPWIDPNDSESFTDWIRVIPQLVRAAGVNRKVTFNAELSPSEREQYGEAPYPRFYRVLNQLVQTDQRYAYMEKQLFKGIGKSGPAIPKLRKHGVMQGVMYYHNGKDFTTKPKLNIMMILSPTATGALGKLSQLRSDSGGSCYDIFTSTPPVMLHFQRSGIAPAIPQGWEVFCISEAPAPQQDGGTQFQHHVIRQVIAPAHVQIPTADFNIKSWIPWDDVLAYTPVREQIGMLLDAFDPDLVKFAFERSEYQSLLPAWITQNTVVSVPMQPAAPPQAAPGYGGYGGGGQGRPSFTQHPVQPAGMPFNFQGGVPAQPVAAPGGFAQPSAPMNGFTGNPAPQPGGFVTGMSHGPAQPFNGGFTPPAPAVTPMGVPAMPMTAQTAAPGFPSGAVNPTTFAQSNDKLAALAKLRDSMGREGPSPAMAGADQSGMG